MTQEVDKDAAALGFKNEGLVRTSWTVLCVQKREIWLISRLGPASGLGGRGFEGFSEGYTSPLCGRATK